MSGRNVITLDQNRHSLRRRFPEESIIAMLVFLIFDAMILTGMVGAFMLTLTASNDTWPPTGQPWFPPKYMVINTVALLTSGVLVFLAARAWEKREARTGRLLFAAIMLGIFFVFFQGSLWVGLIRQGLTLSSSPHGNLFCLIVATHVAHVAGGVIFLSVPWLRLEPLLPDGGYEPWEVVHNVAFRAARLLWYFTVGVWPFLYLCLYL